MAELTCELIGTIAARVLEETAFVFAEQVESAPPFVGEVLQARLSFECGWRGEVLIAASRAIVGASLKDLLDCNDEDPPEATLRDAIGEIANLLAGLLAVALFGQQSVCRLGLPVVSTAMASEHQRVFESATCAAVLLTEDGGRFDVAVLGAPRE